MIEFLVPLFTFTISSTVTPGPNNIMIMTSGLNHGVKKTIPHLMGICFGFPAMVAAVGLGLSAVFIKYPQIHWIIKVLGILYLLYLSWKIATTSTEEKSQKGNPLSFFQAALFQWINPKAWVMSVGAIATFTTVEGNIFLQVALITLSFFMISFPCVGVWLWFGSILQKIIKNPLHQRMFNITMACLLVLSVIPMISSEIV